MSHRDTSLAIKQTLNPSIPLSRQDLSLFVSTRKMWLWMSHRDTSLAIKQVLNPSMPLSRQDLSLYISTRKIWLWMSHRDTSLAIKQVLNPSMPLSRQDLSLYVSTRTKITLNTVIKAESLYQLMYFWFIGYKLKLIDVITLSK